jgi:hypothetical protein
VTLGTISRFRLSRCSVSRERAIRKAARVA